MFDTNDGRRRGVRPNLAATTLLLATLFLAGCGSWGDSINPVNWYKSASNWVTGTPERPPSAVPADASNDEFPNVPDDRKPVRPSAKERAELTEGLVADREHAQHAEEALRREGNPTRPLGSEYLARSADASGPRVADASDGPPSPPPSLPATVVPPAPDAPRLVAGGVVQPPPSPSPAAASSPPAAAALPPSPSAAAPPSPPPAAPSPPPPQVAVAETVPPAPAATSAPAPAPTSLEEAYRRRLAQSGPLPNQTSPGGGGVLPATPPAVPAAANPVPAAAAPAPSVALVSPAQYRSEIARGPSAPRPLSAFDASRSTASFEVASLSFGEGTAELSPDSQARIREVAELYRRKGGSLRIFGHSASPRLDPDPLANQQANRDLADRRAEAVGRELVRLGVPPQHVYAGPDARAVASADSTEIFVDY
jgi:outer membrane protein OmpA-like peptidoglycan-associated protein